MRTSKIFLNLIVAIVVAAALNSFMTFLFEPYGSKSDIMWNDYRQMEKLDTVYFGTSLLARGLDPNVIDEELGTSSYNMATPGQFLEESHSAMTTAMQDHDLEAVVFGLELEFVMLDKVPNPGRAFYRYKNEGDLAGAISDTIMLLSDDRCYTTADSINWIFPWVSNHVVGREKLINNAKMKLGGVSIYEAAEMNERDWHYKGRGYGNYDECYDFDNSKYMLYALHCEEKSFSERKIETLIEMVEEAESQNVDFIAIVPPLPPYQIFFYGEVWYERVEEVRAIVEEHGGELYDMNMAKPELFDTTDLTYYADDNHLNSKGGEAFSHAYVLLRQAKAAGEDPHDCFYTLDEYKASTNYVGLVGFVAKYESGTVNLKASAYSGWGWEKEYQFLVQDADTCEWVVIRDWNSEPTCWYEVSDEEVCTFRVNARVAGNEGFDRYRTATVYI